MSSVQEEKPIKFGVSKYKNVMGVTCYMNSILHILQQIGVFSKYIVQAEFQDTLLSKVDKSQDKEKALKEFVVFELFRLFKYSHENDDTSITPTSFRAVIGSKNETWLERKQQDSPEFFNFLISQLEEEVGTKCTFVPGLKMDDIDTYAPLEENLKIISSMKDWIKYQAKEYSPLKNIFNGLTENTRRCSCCDSMNSVYEPFISLQLSIPINRSEINKSFTIYECLDNFVHEEQLDKDNMMNCDMCGVKNRGFSNIKLWRTPKILVLHLKRFLVNSYGIPTQKLNNNITYPIKDLDLSKYFDVMSPYKDSSKYDLVGVNIHHSFGMMNINMGHYTSFVKNMTNHMWHHYNDANPVQTIMSADQLQTQNAYMLFYYRCD